MHDSITNAFFSGVCKDRVCIDQEKDLDDADKQEKDEENAKEKLNECLPRPALHGTFRAAESQSAYSVHLVHSPH
jgi:hypothetical protein